jgi:heterodisulfide reductase subunit C2
MNASTSLSLAPGAQELARQAQQAGIKVLSCYQCRKCTGGCPVAGRADIKPHELVRLVQLGQRDAALASRAIWECTSCQTCITRCPQKVDIAALNDLLRQMSSRAGTVAVGTAVPVFNAVFLDTVRRFGRMYELGLMVAFKLRTRRLFADVGKFPMMLWKRKLALLPSLGRDRAGRQRLFRRTGLGGAAQ